jgi:two-component system cell cycle sensor histidine kinase/response regulator CckA
MDCHDSGIGAVLFPVMEGAIRTAPAAAASAALIGSGVVLVVDDEQIVRETAKCALERHGYTALLADSGHAAIELFKRHSSEIALVVLELSMPRMNGEEALPELRKIRPVVQLNQSND